jgi:hypothetical protein
MSASKPKIAMTVLAAIASLCQSSLADEKKPVTLLEHLPPQERAALEEDIRRLDQMVKIDWENVVVGVNNEGEIVLVPRKNIKLNAVANPSCWGPN